jgi:hypothetical protein
MAHATGDCQSWNFIGRRLILTIATQHSFKLALFLA